MKKLLLAVLLVFISIISFGQVVISEFYGGGGSTSSSALYKSDFIELYNSSSTDVTMTNWSVQYASASAATSAYSSKVTFSGTIKAKSFFLIQLSSPTGFSGSDLPTPDVVSTSIAAAASAGKIALCNDATTLPATTAASTNSNVVDFLGYGTSQTFEGPGAATAPSNSSTLERKASTGSTASTLASGGTEAAAGNGYDTNNNLSDFVLQTSASPQNSSSSPEPIGSSSTPALTVNPSSLAFNQNVNTTSASQNYTLSGANLTSATTITTAAPFSVSKDNTTFSTSISYTVAELASSKLVYVRYSPTATGNSTGNVTNSSTGASTQTVALTGTGLDPSNLTFNFNNCTGTTTLSDGWIQYSVLGAQTWACTAFGRDPANPSNSLANGVQMNGFASGSNVLNEDWLISPSFNTTSFTYPLLSYWSRTAFNGGPLKLRISTNYSGSGDPNAATWTDLIASFPALASDIWTQTSNIDLSAYKGANVYVAFVYTSTNDEGARWTLDDISLANSATPPPPSAFANPTGLSFGYLAENTTATRTFALSSSNLTGGVTLTSSSPIFQLSKDGTTFSNSITYTVAEADNQAKQVTVRFNPTVAFTNYSGSITASSPNITDFTISLSGNTYNTANTLEVVNWNIEWFGSTVAGLGPTNKNQQEANIKTILSNLNADIYGLLEVVSEARLQNIVNSMPGYSYKISDFGSYADNVSDPDYAGAQKLAFVYKTNLFSNIVISSFFRCTQAQNCPEFNYWSSGRFPYVMEADVTLNGVVKRMSFVLIHAKANTSPTATSYDRRKNGAIALKNKLDADYPTSNFIVLGDFNDDLDQTITAGITPPVTSYSSFTADPVNYIALTLPLSLAGKKSTVSYNDIIDHVVVSNEMNSFYISNSAEILNGVAGLVTNYGTTTTDHYPVLTRYAFGNAAPTLSAIAPVSICYTQTQQTVSLSGITPGPESTQTTSLSISTTNPAMFSSLTVSSGTSGNGTITYTLSPNATGTASITVTVKDDGGTENGGTDTFSRTFSITSNALPLIAISSDKGINVVKSALVTLTATGGSTYSWTNTSTAGTVTGAVIQVSPAQTTTYQVTATNAVGCTSAQTITLNVVVPNEAPTLNIIAPVSICFTVAPQTIALSGISPGPETSQATTISVSTTNAAMFSALTVASGTNGNGTLNYTLSSTGIGIATVTVTVKDNGGTANGGSDTFTRTFTITSNPLPVVLITSSAGLDISKGLTASLTATGGSTYTWTNTSTAGTVSGPTITVRPFQTTTYQVVATSAAGCTSTQKITLTVLDDYTTITAVNVLTPNGDGKNDMWVVRNIDFYPNNKVFVYDKSGRLVFSKNNYTNDWAGTYNGTTLNEDSYIYVVDIDNGQKRIKGALTIIRDK